MPSPSQQFAGLYDSFGNTMADPNFTASQLDSALYNPITGYVSPSSVSNSALSANALDGNVQRNARSITIDNTSQVQKALDTLNELGGGTLILNPYTYKLTGNLTLYSNIAMLGNGPGVTIDFGATASTINIVGSSAYSAGTVAISNGGTTVTGSGTTWTAAMVGQNILLGDFWYPITARASNTSITIGSAYSGTNLSGAAYRIATTIDNVTLSNLTVQNASGSLVTAQYANNLTMDGVVYLSGGTGLTTTDCSTINFLNFTVDSNGTGYTATNTHVLTAFNGLVIRSSSGGGFVFNTVTNTAVIAFTTQNITGDGLKLTSCSNLGIENYSVRGSTGKGIDVVSGNSNIQIINGLVDTSTSDGIYLGTTNTNIDIVANSITNNGAYGVNVSASSNTDIIISSNAFDTNTSGAVNDLGASTIIRGNTGVTDNSLQIPFGGTGVDGALSISSGTTTLDLGSANTFIKNYTSISITGTAKLAFSNPAATGTVILLKSQGNVTITSSTVPAIDVRLMGGTGGGPGAAAGFLSAGADGSDGFGTTTYPIAGLGGTTTVTDIRTGGSGTHVSATILGRSYNIFAGSGGGGGGQSSSSTAHGGTGGTGGGGLIIECLGALNITSTINVSGQAGTSGAAPGSGGGGSISGASGGGGQVSGTNGSAGSAGTGSGGGGGGGGGSVAIVYKTLTANSGTYTVAGGAAGSSTGTAGAAGAGGNGYSLVAVNTSFP